jgi:protein ImuB
LRARLAFAEPAAAPDDIARVPARLAGDLCAQLARAGLGARRLALTLHRADGTSARIALGTSRPMRDPAAIGRLFAEPVQHFDPQFGIDLATLDAEIAAPLPAEQRRLANTLSPTGDTRDGLEACTQVAPLVDRLANRLGAANVTRLAFAESHLPERAQARVAPLSPLPPALRGARPPRAPRPLRLFARPEPIDVAAEMPDAPPMLFRWRRLVHHIAATDGPERIACEWWRSAAEPRDYFRLEDREGRRFWVFREGLWTAARERPPRWYLHGLFA